MDLAFDLDDTLIRTFLRFLAHCNRKHRETFKYHQFTSHDFNSIWQISPEAWLERWWSFDESDEAKDIPPMPGAQETIARLAKRHQLHIITARPEEMRDQTTILVERLFGEVFRGRMHFCAKDRGVTVICSKVYVCKLVGAQMHFDDHPGHLNMCLAGGVRPWVVDQPWNHQVAMGECHEHATRISHWDEEVLAPLWQN